ncbi:MAG: hypothetical protein MJY80_03590 [Bacteroidales bacterium]|nr:hypothetical protein [Bacteroidales bacterium]
MKANKIFAILLGCVLTLGISSCVEKAPEYVPGEPCTATCVVTPDLSVPSNLDLNGTPIEVPFVRNTTDGAIDVTVELNDPTGIFSLQSNTISFAGGSNTAKAYVTYDYDRLSATDSYVVEVTVTSEAYTSPYNAVTAAFSCVKAWKDLGVGQFFDNLVLMTSDSYGIANCTILQSPDGTPRYRIMAPYANKAQRIASWGEAEAQATPSEYIEFWVNDEAAMTVTWNNFWLTGLWYGGNPGDDIKAYLPSVKGSSNANCRFVEDKVVRFTPYYYIDGLGGFGCYDCYLSFPGGPDLEEWL